MSSTSRKSHRKTRTGCGHCKRRKIKCDEQKPECLNCLKHSIRCDFPQLSSSRESTNPSPSARDNHLRSPISSFHSNGQSDYHRDSGAVGDDHGHRPLDLNMTDLELLHHFSTSTCHTLSSKPELKVLWQVTIPQLAFSQDFLMRGLLAVSALHLAHFASPGKRERYAAQAAVQQDLALSAVRPAMSNVTKENCDALFIFSTIVLVLTFAQPCVPGTLVFTEPRDQGMSEWLSLIRGVHSILISAWDWIEGGKISPILKSGGYRTPPEFLGPPESDRLVELSNLIEEATIDEADLEIYNAAIAKLRRSFAIAYSSDTRICNLAPAFAWPIGVSDEYIALLRKHTPEALAIFAHYSILLKKLDGFWWVQGWGTNILSTTYGLLDNAHRLWIRWPIQECGWIPPRHDD